MSAERHAMEAALEYSKKLEADIVRLNHTNNEYSRTNRLLRQKLERIKDALSDGNYHQAKSDCVEAQSSSPMCGMPEDCPRCKNCGAPI